MTTVSFKSDLFKCILALNEVKTSTINKEEQPLYYVMSLFQIDTLHDEVPLEGYQEILKHQWMFSHHQNRFGLYIYASLDPNRLEEIKEHTIHMDRVRGYKPILTGQHSYHVGDIQTRTPFIDFLLSLKEGVFSSHTL